MLGGIDNQLFLQGLGGFLALFILIPIAKWTATPQTTKLEKKNRRNLIKDLRRLKRK